MKRIIILIIAIFFPFNLYAETIDLKYENEYEGKFLWMSCNIQEAFLIEDQKELFKRYYRTFKFSDDWDLLFPSKNILISNWNDTYKINKGYGTSEIYKNDLLLYDGFSFIKSIDFIDWNLIFYWQDLNWKNFIQVNENKKLTKNNYSIQSIKKIGNDFYVLYWESNSIDGVGHWNFYLYKGNDLYYSVENMTFFNFWLLENGKIYITHSKFHWLWTLLIDKEVIKSQKYYHPTSTYITSNNKFKIFEHQVFEFIYWLEVNWEEYHSNDGNILFDVSWEEDSIVFFVPSTEESKLFRIEDGIVFTTQIPGNLFSKTWFIALKYWNENQVYFWVRTEDVFKRYECKNETVLDKVFLRKHIIISKKWLSKISNWNKYIQQIDTFINNSTKEQKDNLLLRIKENKEKNSNNPNFKLLLDYLEYSIHYSLLD